MRSDYEAIPGITPEQERQATRRIAERAHDGDDARLLLGIVFGKTQVRAPRGLKGRPTRSEDGLKPHGTEAAYQRHKARGEKACEPCLAAANAARSASARAARAAARAKKGARA